MVIDRCYDNDWQDMRRGSEVVIEEEEMGKFFKKKPKNQVIDEGRSLYVLAIGTRSAFFFHESRRIKVPRHYSKESMSSGTF